MKKREKIMIGILALILIIMLAILFFTKTNYNQNIGTNVGNQNTQAIEETQNNTQKEQKRIINVNGELYYDTGKACDETAEVQRCGTMDGNITSVIERTEIPQKDGEANFEGARGYQFGREENQIDVPLENEGWIIFEARSYTFCGVIKQVEENLFFVEPDNGEEIKKSADLIMVGKLQLDTNVKFVVGEKIKITYDGYVMETYPAQVKAIKYEIINS